MHFPSSGKQPVLWSLMVLFLAGLAYAEKPELIQAGPLTLEIHVSETAHTFHIVDQLSAWSEYCHQQYADHFTDLSKEDRALLAEHAGVREFRSWGQGLEQTFYTDLPLEDALREGVAASRLTQDQADVERRVLSHFQDRALALMKEETPTLQRFTGTLRKEQPKLADFSVKASRFCGVSEIRVPVYLIANPDAHSMGGGYNGGRLTLEIPRESDPIGTFLHEVMHAFVHEQMPLLEKTASTSSGLDVETLNEGIAYALSPGILHNGSQTEDPLAQQVASDIHAGKPLSDSYTRFNRYGLALRPLLQQAMEDETATLTAFLPRAVDAWEVTAELSRAFVPGETQTKWIGKKSSSPTMFVLAPADINLYRALKAKWRYNQWGRNHSNDMYDEMFELHAKPGDLLVMLFALDKPERIPDEYKDLLPRPWPEIEEQLKRGETIIARGKARDLNVLLLAIPSENQLPEILDKLGPDLLSGQ